VNMPAPYIPGNPLRPVQTLAIAGGKGGSGKSVVAVNLAVALGASGHDVLLVDGALEMGNVDRLLGLKPQCTTKEVIRNECLLQDAILQGPEGVTVVPSAHGALDLIGLSQIEHAGLIGLFSDIRTPADTLIVDIATGLSDSVVSFCRAVREVVVVVEDEPTAMHDALSIIQVLHEQCLIRRFRVVANKTDSSRHGLEVYGTLAHMADKRMDVLLDYCGSIPFDSQMKLAVSQQRSVVEAFPRSPATLAFRKLGSRVARWPKPQTPCGQIEFFVERLIDTADRDKVRKTSV